MPKHNIGDLVFVDNPEYDNKQILEITKKHFRKFEEDLVPHRYYSGNIISLTRNKETNLYEPIENIKNSYKAYIKKAHISKINSNVVDIKKLMPHF